MRFAYAPGATPIDLDEAKGLIPAHLDLLLIELAGRRFEWGRGSLVAANDLRARYIEWVWKTHQVQIMLAGEHD